MILKLYENNPNEKTLDRVAEVLDGGGVIIYPTDSIYAVGCSLRNAQAIARLLKITGKDRRDLTIVCSDLSNIADYASVDNPTFRTLKRNVPGPFTFVLKASSKVPDKILEKRKTVGVRVPDNAIARAIVSRLGVPLVSASVKDDDQVVEYTTDPELIHERYGAAVDLVVDGGYGGNVPTTVVGFDGGEPEIIRQGKGELE